jgi:hypothetical protein
MNAMNIVKQIWQDYKALIIVLFLILFFSALSLKEIEMLVHVATCMSISTAVFLIFCFAISRRIVYLLLLVTLVIWPSIDGIISFMSAAEIELHSDMHGFRVGGFGDPASIMYVTGGTSKKAYMEKPYDKIPGLRKQALITMFVSNSLFLLTSIALYYDLRRNQLHR